MAFADLMKSGIPETSEEEQIRLQQLEAEKINLFEGWEDVDSDDLLFSPPNEVEDPAERSRNTLQAYYSKELGVDSLPDFALDQFLTEDFGEGVDYDTALESLRDSKRWGTEARDPTKMELAKHEKLTTGDWLRSFSGHTTKAIYGIDAGLMRAAAATASALGQEDSKFYHMMMGAADDATAEGQNLLEHMTEAGRFAEDAASDKAMNDIFAQNMGQLMVVVPLGIATGGTSWGVSLSTVGTVNAGMLYNEAFEQAREVGQSDEEALKTAGLYTLAAAPAETIVDLASAGVFKPFTQYASTLASPVRRSLVRTAIQSATAAGPGGFVEGGQYALLNKMTNKEIDQGEFWATVRAGAILEGLGGSITHISGEVDTARAKVKLRKDFRPVFGNETDAVVDRIFADDEPNNALNREVLNLIEADFESISLLGKKSELKKRAEAASDATFNELWKQVDSEERAALDAEVQRQAELEAHASPVEIVLEEVGASDADAPEEEAAPVEESTDTPADTSTPEQRRKEQEAVQKENKKRKADLMEAMTADEEQRTYLREDGTEVYEDGTPVEVAEVDESIEEAAAPVPVNRLDPNHPKNLARLTLAIMENEGISQEEAVKKLTALPSDKRKQYLEILDDGTMETVSFTPEDREIAGIDARLEEINRMPKPVETKTAFPKGLTSARIRTLKETMTREQAQQMYADGDQKNDFIAGVFDGDRQAVQRFNERSLGREHQLELDFDSTTSYEEATQAVGRPQAVEGEDVTTENGDSGTISGLSEDGTLATVNGKSVLTGKLKRGKKGVSKKISGKVAEKLVPTDQKEVSAGAKILRQMATREYKDDPNLTVEENLKAREDLFFSKIPELAKTLGVTEEELLVEGRQADLVNKLAETDPDPKTNPVEASTAAVVESTINTPEAQQTLKVEEKIRLKGTNYVKINGE